LGIEKEALEHRAAGEEMQPALGGFRIGGLGTKNFTGCAEPLEPSGIFRGELFFELLAKALGECRAFAVGGDGDLEVAALNDGAVIEVAMVDVVDGVAEDAALFSFEIDRLVDIVERSGSDDKEHTEEVFSFKGLREPIDFAAADPFDELRREFGGNDGDTCAGFEKAGDFGSSDGAATDHEDGAVVEF